jgi:hypothetical protein
MSYHAIISCSKLDEKRTHSELDREKLAAIVEVCRLDFIVYLKNIYTDYRYLGIVVMEAYTLNPIDFQEKEVMLRPTYTFADLSYWFDISRATKGVHKLLQFCFMKIPPDNELVIVADTKTRYGFASATTLPEVDDILQLLGSEMDSFGGINGPDLSPADSFVTDEDREKFRIEKERRKNELDQKAIEGRYLAADRVVEHNKQVC